MPDGSSSSPSPSSVAESSSHEPSRLFAPLRLVSLLTMASRILGLVRDIGMAALFGNGPVMDAFSVAFRIPNLARRLFGEGALTAAFLPVFVREMEQAGKDSAWKLASAVLTLLAATLCGLVLLAELLLGSIFLFGQMSYEAQLLIGLTAALLPYLVLICLAAQISAILHAWGQFTRPALLPILLNLIWIACIWLVAPLFSTQVTQIYVIAGCVVLAGLVQLTALLPTLYQLGFHYHRAWNSTRARVTEIGLAMLPVLIGLSITQLNTLTDSLIAWGFSQSEAGATTMNLPGNPAYPLRTGTAAALYFGQRMYQFPLGVFGVALGTVLFPLLSRNAERGRFDLLRDDLSLGLRLVAGIGFPASLGLFLLAEPLTVLLFQHGEFGPEASRQTAGMIEAYGIGVWAYCGLLIIQRGYYAVGDRITPLRVGLVTVVLNLVMNLTLIWFLGGWGLALGTALAAIFQLIVVGWLLQSRIGNLQRRGLLTTTCKALLATALMGIICVLVRDAMPSGETMSQRLLRVIAPLIASVAVYLAVAHVIGLSEPWRLLKRNRRREET